jgi:outer membrane lipoprotein carrier protein
MKTVLSLVLAAWACLAQATGLQSLEQFVVQVRAGQASFTQSVNSPPKAGAVARVKTSRGTFAFERPGRFRFDYNKPFAQSMVADGQTLWMHDPDLNQVTARDQAAALGQTPAALIASSTDLSELRKQFALSDLPDAEGLQWVQAVPVRADGTVRSVRLAFVPAQSSSTPPVLAVLEIEDSFGQRSVMRFEQFQIKANLPPDTFRFTPPPGADLVRP